MAPALNTIPDAPADEAAPLTAAPQSKTSIKGLVAGAAVASFVLGLMAATAVTSAAAPRAPAAFSSKIHRQQIRMTHDDNLCLTVKNPYGKYGSSLSVDTCRESDSQLFNYDGDLIH